MDRNQFIEYMQSMRAYINRENAINDFMQAISEEFMYSSNMDVVHNLMELIEQQFPINCKKYEQHQEEWVSPISEYFYNIEGSRKSEVRFYDINDAVVICVIRDYGELYDQLLTFEKE